ncbi:MAG: ABC transporter ATP-binding protein [Deltaproteobacteria bacterium]|nr:ABC transporter ATP-binding protein [Deltaproteobacteria bacterium]
MENNLGASYEAGQHVSENTIEVSNLTKYYNSRFSIAGRTFGQTVRGTENVSFIVQRGEIFGFLGPNGAGKTTTIRSMLGYLHPQSGTITILGMDHAGDAMKIRERIGYIPGDLALYRNYTGEELINFFHKLRPMDKAMMTELKRMFKVNLSQKVKKLSSGNRQQLALILAVGSNPELLIMDEPTSGLDPLMVSRFHALLRRLSRAGTTIFLSSHDLAEVQAVCDRVGIIRNGIMVEVETVEALRHKAVQHMTLQFEDNEDTRTEEVINELKTHADVRTADNGVMNLTIKGDVNEVIRLISRTRVKRMTLEDAPLEDIFLQYYMDESELKEVNGT